MNIAAIGENQYYAVLKFSLVSLENVKGGHGNTGTPRLNVCKHLHLLNFYRHPVRYKNIPSDFTKLISTSAHSEKHTSISAHWLSHLSSSRRGSQRCRR